jgi:thioredoxin reductase
MLFGKGPETPAQYDVIIVGGGPAGLSAALVLGRCLRRVLICDSGEPRNKPAEIFNGYLSRDASDPAEFLEISRQQLERYKETVEFRRGVVKEVARDGERFTATLETGETVDSRILLIATGLVDDLPEFENFRDFYGKTAHSCPYCDGWEVRGQALAVTGNDQASADLAIELLLWSKDVTLCTSGDLECDRKTRRRLKLLEVPINEKPVKALEGEDGKLAGLRFTDGSFLPCAALFFAPHQRQHSPLAEQLNCDLCREDNCIKCEEQARTSVPGVYAAGNCSRGIQLVTAAVAEGMQAAFAINDYLLEKDAKSGALKEDN